jgi:hypothetical protein
LQKEVKIERTKLALQDWMVRVLAVKKHEHEKGQRCGCPFFLR